MSNLLHNLTMVLSDEACKDILTTAVQGGGSAYWANEYDGLTEENDDAGYVTVFGIGEPDEDTDCNEPVVNHRVTYEDMRPALQWLIDNTHKPSGSGAIHKTMLASLVSSIEPLGCGCDGYEADAVLQVAIFGKVIYG